MSFGRALKKKKEAPLKKWATKQVEIFKKNEEAALMSLKKDSLEIRGFILQRLVVNTMYVLTNTFGFRKSQFDKFNAGMDYMSDIVKSTRDYSAWDCQQGLLEECKYEFKKREPLKLDLMKWLTTSTKEELEYLLSYRNIYDCLATNGAIQINEPWESMVCWVLHEYLGFGKVRLERFQSKMAELWAVPNEEMKIMTDDVSKKLKIKRLKVGTTNIHLPIIARKENIA